MNALLHLLEDFKEFYSKINIYRGQAKIWWLFKMKLNMSKNPPPVAAVSGYALSPAEMHYFPLPLEVFQ